MNEDCVSTDERCRMSRPAPAVSQQFSADSAEQARASDLILRFPASGAIALDVGTRDGYFALRLAERFDVVLALDLDMPTVDDPKVRCLVGDAVALPLDDNSVDFTLCAEVLEHIPAPKLPAVCRELTRVTRDRLLIGVPYRQDIRVARSTCAACGGINPPWGHVNHFDENGLEDLFPGCRVESVSYVGSTSDRTNPLSRWLMDRAGNPYGTYGQSEPCIHCGAQLVPPPPRSFGQKALTKLAGWSSIPSRSLHRPRAKWMHMLLSTGGKA